MNSDDCRGYGEVYVAVTVTGPVMVSTQRPVPVQAPLQPKNVVPESAATTG